ncbi:MAG: VCBS repeat-containing protein [Candidatus Hydrogenedentes bacterium]|nr:VCBS repeat-containing protein [Candidatus Hydrogenedentota bacterium]
MLSSVALAVVGVATAFGVWPMHVIDQSSKGADGVRLSKPDESGRFEIATGWEEGGDVRVVTKPDVGAIREPWPSLSVGNVESPEDAVQIDLDADGWLDVVSCTEGKNQSVYVHWNPGPISLAPTPGLNSIVTHWKPRAVPALEKKAAWMFCVPLSITNGARPDLVIGAKDPNGQIGWLETKGTSRRTDSWKWHKLRTAGWVMSLVAEDMDGDGDQDILFSDRKGPATGVYWLERTDDVNVWPEHEIGARGREVMFITTGDIDGDGDRDVAAAVKPRDIIVFLREDVQGTKWRAETITFSDAFGTSKAVCIADIDNDGLQDLAVTCEQADTASGVFWLSRAADGKWNEHDIAGAPGIKYDLIVPYDLDGDGDLDLITCEEREINAVIWYENPTVPHGAGE